MEGVSTKLCNMTTDAAASWRRTACFIYAFFRYSGIFSRKKGIWRIKRKKRTKKIERESRERRRIRVVKDIESRFDARLRGRHVTVMLSTKTSRYILKQKKRATCKILITLE